MILVAEPFSSARRPWSMLVRPAVVADRADIDEADFGLASAAIVPKAIAAAAAASASNCCLHVDPYPLRFLLGSHPVVSCQRSGTNGLPSQAGVFISVNRLFARDQNQDDDGRQIGQRRKQLRAVCRAPSAWAWSWPIDHCAEQVGAGKHPPGRQEAKTTSASAIQPRPAVMFSAHIGVRPATGRRRPGPPWRRRTSSAR